MDELIVEVDEVSGIAVIAAALRDNKTADRLIKSILPDIFVDKTSQQIWGGILKARQRKLDPTPELLQQITGGVVAAGVVSAILDQFPNTPLNLSHHLQTLQWDHSRAEAARGPLQDLLVAIQDPSSQPEKVEALAKAVCTTLKISSDRQFMLDPDRVTEQTIEGLIQRRKHGVHPYFIDGFDKFEDGKWRITAGVEPKFTTVITGSSGAGKSVIAALIALAQAKKGYRVLYGAWEMGAQSTLELMAHASLGISRTSMQTGDITDQNLVDMRTRMTQIQKKVRFFNPPFSKFGNDSNEASLTKLFRQISDSGAQVVVLDLWERMIPDGTPGAERRALFAQQAIAQETNTHCILVAQQRLKEIEKRVNPRPTRDGILGSSAWVDIADTIIGVYRQALWKPSLPDDKMELLILKQRHGRWPYSVELDWDGDMCSLKNGRTIKVDNPTLEGDSRMGAFGK